MNTPDQMWQEINQEWLTRLRESAEKLEGLTVHCSALEKRIRILEALVLNINAFDEILARLPDTRRRLEKQETAA